MKTVLVTGSAGFIGFHLSLGLLKMGFNVVGIDNLNSYYSKDLKDHRLKILKEKVVLEQKENNYFFYKCDITDTEKVDSIFSNHKPSVVVNLAAQAGVRYSIDNPDAYISSNINGFYEILKLSHQHRIEHFLFASSSSVYGLNTSAPYKENDKTDFPISLYAATKKSNELMAFSYSHLFNMPITGLRFFTVYGPYGRPDMAYYKFAEKIMNGEPIDIFNNGNLKRDFTYIDDVINAIKMIISKKPKKLAINETTARPRFKIYNIGNENPVSLTKFIKILESHLGIESRKNFLPMQDGDVKQTYADTSNLKGDFKIQKYTELNDGLKKFVDWYKAYIGIQK